MRRLEFILATLALVLAGTATAATWTWTEVRAESWSRTHVRYFDDDAWGEQVQNLENARSGVQQCHDYPDSFKYMPHECEQRQRYYDALSAKKRSDFILYPGRVDCRGASPSRDAYHFWRFRCRVWFQQGWGDVRVTVTGKNRAVSRWL